MLLVNFKARQDPPSHPVSIVFSFSSLYIFKLNGAGSLLDLLMQVKQKALTWLKAIFLQTSSLRCGEIWAKNEQWLLARQASIRGLAKSIEKNFKKEKKENTSDLGKGC